MFYSKDVITIKLKDFFKIIMFTTNIILIFKILILQKKLKFLLMKKFKQKEI